MPAKMYTSSNALLLRSTYKTHYLHTSDQQQTATHIYHAINIYVPVTDMSLNCQICHINQLLHVQISDTFVSVYTS